MGQTATTKNTIKCLLHFTSSDRITTMLVSDNGPQFTASSFAKYCQSNRIEHSPLYYPANNGLVERIVKVLNSALEKLPCTDPGLSVSHFLSAYDNTPHSVTQQTPTAITFCHVPVTPFQLLQPAACNLIKRLADCL